MKRNMVWTVMVSTAVMMSVAAVIWAFVATSKTKAVHLKTPTDARYVAVNIGSPARHDEMWGGATGGFQLFRIESAKGAPAKGAKPSQVVATAAALNTKCPFVLVEIRRVPFRMQLVGFATEPEGCIGMFELEGSHALVMARAGRRFEEHGLVIESLLTERCKEGFVAVAKVRDMRSGESVILKSSGRVYENARMAVITVPGDPKPRVLIEGGKLDVGGQTWIIESIGADMVSVVLNSQSGASAHLRTTLGLTARTNLKNKTKRSP